MLVQFLSISYNNYYYSNLLQLYMQSSSASFLHSLNLYNYSSLYLLKPKSQLFISVIGENNNIYSTGYALNVKGVIINHYNSYNISYGPFILFLLELFSYSLKNIYYFGANNFNYSIWLFLNNFYTLVDPFVIFFLQTNSYNTYNSPVNRINRRVLSLLNNQL